MEVFKSPAFSPAFNALADSTKANIQPKLIEIYQELGQIEFIEEIDSTRFDVWAESGLIRKAIQPGDTIFGIRLSDAYVLYLAGFGTAVTTCNLLTIGYVARD